MGGVLGIVYRVMATHLIMKAAVTHAERKRPVLVGHFSVYQHSSHLL